MRLLIILSYVLAAWKWTDWKRWKEYYPTIVFMIAVNWAVAVLTYKHTLWKFSPSYLLNYHSVSNFVISMTVFPATVLLFLSRFPEGGLFKKGRYIAYWVAVYGFTELVTSSTGIIEYQNGWSFAWSVVLDCIMFPILWIHHKNPLLAWLLTLVAMMALWFMFGFSVSDFKA